MNMRLIIFVGLFILINSFSENCQTCLEGQIYVWGVDVYRNMVAGTISRCCGILSCNVSICATYRI